MEAEDVTQEVFIKLYTRLSRFNGECRFSTWLYRVTWNHALDAQRRAARLHGNKVDLRDIPELRAGTQPDPWGATQQRARLDRLIDRLPESQKIALRLHYWLGYELREIAEFLACSENTVKSYLFRARKTLGSRMERDHE